MAYSLTSQVGFFGSFLISCKLKQTICMFKLIYAVAKFSIVGTTSILRDFYRRRKVVVTKMSDRSCSKYDKKLIEIRFITKVS